MSRREVAGRKPGTRVVVGWDQPMLTFFVHVFDPASRMEGPSTWLGCSLRELYDMDDLRRAIGPHADFPAELANELYDDRDEGR